jgi:hypothetical protein
MEKLEERRSKTQTGKFQEKSQKNLKKNLKKNLNYLFKITLHHINL